jgi:hypothetical protein
MAQEQQATGNAPEAAQFQEVVVTGSRIAAPNDRVRGQVLSRTITLTFRYEPGSPEVSARKASRRADVTADRR